MSTPPLRPVLLALAAFSLFSVGDAVIKELAAHHSAFTVAFYVAGMVTIMVLALAAARGEVRTLFTLPDRQWHIARGFCLVVQFCLLIHALGVMPMADVYALLFTAPLLTVPLAWVFLGERPPLRHIALVAAGFAGVLLILRPGLIAPEPAALGMIVAASCFALSHIFARRMRAPTQPVLSWPLYAELVIVLCVTPFFLQAPVLPSAYHLLLLFIVAALSIGGLTLIGTALQSGSTARVAPTQYVQMLWAVALGYLFFGDVPDGWVLAGAGLVIGSGLLLYRRA